MVAQLTKNILKKKKKKKKLTKKNNNNGGRKTCHGQSSADFETLLFLTKSCCIGLSFNYL
jgi:hypothetical protein